MSLLSGALILYDHNSPNVSPGKISEKVQCSVTLQNLLITNVASASSHRADHWADRADRVELNTAADNLYLALLRLSALCAGNGSIKSTYSRDRYERGRKPIEFINYRILFTLSDPARPDPTVTLFRSLYLWNRAFDRQAVFYAW